ncbi:helix-turn-helix domain-containing protein [Nocardia sp. NPDC002869]|uniref:helix-turn-helix domain-containing protein n=1 Tax=Nocardia sp. NPDC002869 TaxID=3161032 RepID=UPI00398D0AF4
MTGIEERYCVDCGGLLSRYNPGEWCGSCTPTTADTPLEMPAQFWWSEHMLAALSSWHMGRVIYAYRTHPLHGPQPIAQKKVANWLDLTQAQLSRIETGPAPEHLTKLIRWAQVLRIPAELLWFGLPPASTLGEVNRNEFLRAAAAVTATAAASPHGLMQLLNDTRSTAIPARVGAAEIEQLRAASDLFAGWDALYGGGLVREVVAAQLRVAVSYLHAGCAPGLRSDLYSAVGYLSHTAGFMAFDACAHRDATEMFGLALKCAEQADAWQLRAKILSSMARHAIWTGKPKDGLRLATSAFLHSDRLTATERAMLFTTQARAYGKLGDVDAVATAIGRADEQFSHSEPAEGPSWMAYYDGAQHAGDTGHALFDIAVRGRFRSEARGRLEAAVAGHTSDAERSRTISMIKLASLTMSTGDPDEAAEIGTVAVGRASGLKSMRAAEDVHELRSYARRAGVDLAPATG